MLLVVLSSSENSDPGLAVRGDVVEYLLFVGEGSQDSKAVRGRAGVTRSDG
jgi:hypothetical protein